MNLYRVDMHGGSRFVVCETITQAFEWAARYCAEHPEKSFIDPEGTEPLLLYGVVEQERIAAVWRKPADVTLPFAGGWS